MVTLPTFARERAGRKPTCGGAGRAGSMAIVTTTIWVDGWQQECCGEPFALGAALCAPRTC
jgi:hypothetical protein